MTEHSTGTMRDYLTKNYSTLKKVLCFNPCPCATTKNDGLDVEDYFHDALIRVMDQTNIQNPIKFIRKVMREITIDDYNRERNKMFDALKNPKKEFTEQEQKAYHIAQRVVREASGWTPRLTPEEVLTDSELEHTPISSFFRNGSRDEVRNFEKLDLSPIKQLSHGRSK